MGRRNKCPAPPPTHTHLPPLYLIPHTAFGWQASKWGWGVGVQRVTSIQSDIPPIDLSCLVPQRWITSLLLQCSHLASRQKTPFSSQNPSARPAAFTRLNYVRMLICFHRSSSKAGRCSSSLGPSLKIESVS